MSQINKKKEAEKYFIINNIKEQIELKNTINTKGLLGFKDRYAILTTTRLIYFDNSQKFLEKRKPRVNLVNFMLEIL